MKKDSILMTLSSGAFLGERNVNGFEGGTSFLFKKF